MNDRFEELLPWYVNGTLSKADAEWVAEYVRTHPEAQAELSWYQSLQTKIREDVPAVPADVGYAKFMQRVRAEQPAPRTVKAPTMGERLRGFLGSFSVTPRLAFATAIILVQAGIIGKLLLDGGLGGTNPYAEVRSTSQPVHANGDLIRLSFRPDARESDIRFALVSVGATIIDGPTQLGDYLVKVPAGKGNVSIEQLMASATVDHVTLLTGDKSK